jgi:hypothetical protein
MGLIHSNQWLSPQQVGIGWYGCGKRSTCTKYPHSIPCNYLHNLGRLYRNSQIPLLSHSLLLFYCSVPTGGNGNTSPWRAWNEAFVTTDPRLGGLVLPPRTTSVFIRKPLPPGDTSPPPEGVSGDTSPVFEAPRASVTVTAVTTQDKGGV